MINIQDPVLSLSLKLLPSDAPKHLAQSKPEIALPLNQFKDICFFSELLLPSFDHSVIFDPALAATHEKVGY